MTYVTTLKIKKIPHTETLNLSTDANRSTNTIFFCDHKNNFLEGVQKKFGGFKNFFKEYIAAVQGLNSDLSQG